MIEWFRWWHGTVTDPKFRWIAKKSNSKITEVLSVWAALLEHASNVTQCNADETRGNVTSFQCEDWDIQFEFEDGQTQKIVRAMEEKGLIKNGEIYNWQKRQPKREDSSTERVRRYREKKKLSSISSDETQCNAVKRKETLDTDKDKEKNINTETTNVVSCSEQTKFAHEPDEKVDEAAIKLILKDETLYRIPQEKIAAWQELYPGVDVIAELKSAKSWCLDNPKKRKTKNGIGRFINAWLARASKQAGPPPDKKFQSEVKKIFNEILPVNPINQWSKQAEKDLQARIDEDPKRRSVNFWRNFFLLVKCGSNIKQHEWHLDYLVRDQTFANILNGKRHSQEEIERYKKLKQQNSAEVNSSC